MPKSTPVLILAAGASSRMKGEIKQLLPWRKSTLLENAVHQANEVSENVYVVLGAKADKILESISLDAQIICNQDWKLGMGSSISCGLNHILEKENPEAILIMLADQPLIDDNYLQELLQTFSEGASNIVATAYKSGAGVPAIFSKSLFTELRSLQGEIGAKKIIHQHAQKTDFILPNGKEIDIDTKEKYNQLIDIQNIKNE